MQTTATVTERMNNPHQPSQDTLAQRIALAEPARVAAVDSHRSITYGELLYQARQVAQGMGPDKGLVVLACENTIDWLIGYVAVLMGRHAAFLVAADATAYQAVLARQFQASLLLSASAQTRPQPLADHPPTLHPELSILLSTSGSTGSPKCVRLSNTNLASNAQSIATYLEITDSDRGVVSLPVHYSYGLSIVNSHLWAGATLLLTDKSMIEPEFWAFCREHQATSFGGVPHSYELLARIDFAEKAPSSLRYFTQAGGRLDKPLIERFAHLAADHGWRFFVMYGQTEASPRIAWLPPALTLTHLGSIGVAIPGGNLSVQDDGGHPLPPGTPGELVYEGPNVMMGYALTAADLALGQGSTQLHTGDIAHQTPDGFFYITGRKSRFVKIFGNRIGLDETEAICASGGLPAIVSGNDEKLLVVTRLPGAQADLTRLLSQKLKIPENTIDVRHMDAYPLMPSGKIDYGHLKALLAETPTASTPHHGTVQGIYRQFFGAAVDDGSLSFYDLGGDSLTFVRVSLDLESTFGPLPDHWHRLPAQALDALLREAQHPAAARPQTSASFANLDTLRALACVAVVAFHVLGDDPTTGLNVPAQSPWRLPFEGLDLIRMPLFTALAGLMYASMASMYDNLGRYIKHRFVSLMVPAVVLSLVYFALRTAAGKTEPPLQLIGPGYLHFWYLYALFEIAVVVALIDKLLLPGAWGWLAVVAADLAIHLWAEPSSFSGALSLTPYYVLGVVISRHAGLLQVAGLWQAALAVALAGLVAKYVNFYDPSPWRMAMEALASAALVVLAVRFMPKVSAIEWIGVYSYVIYLWHPAANAVMRTVLTRLGVESHAVLFPLGMVVGIAVPILIQRTVKNWPTPVRLPLTGG